MPEVSVSVDRIVADVGTVLLGSKYLHFFLVLYDCQLLLLFLAFILK